MSEHADALLARVASGEKDGAAANALVREIGADYPVERLLPLLLGTDDDVASAAVWIASELGPRCLPLAPVMATLLAHRSASVRFWAVEVILVMGPATPDELTARTAHAVGDDDPGVRWKAMEFLARIELDRLASSATHGVQSPDGELIGWLVDCARSANGGAIIDALNSARRERRLVAAAAAARLARVDTRALRFAAGVAEEEVRSFAAEWLEAHEREAAWLARRRARAR